MLQEASNIIFLKNYNLDKSWKSRNLSLSIIIVLDKIVDKEILTYRIDTSSSFRLMILKNNGSIKVEQILGYEKLIPRFINKFMGLNW